MTHFNEYALEMAIMELFENEGYIYTSGEDIHKELSDVLLRDDGIIPFVALPGKMLYRESDLRAVLEKNYVAPFAHPNAEDFPTVYNLR